MMTQGKVTVILGGQAGSEGKGKFAGYLALHDDFGAAVSNFMPNAGHTWVANDGRKVMVQQLPQAVVNSDMELYISAGAAIDPLTLINEMIKYGVPAHRLHVHPRAMVIEEQDRIMEGSVLKRISSTLKGCGAALARKVLRHSNVHLAGGVDALLDYVDMDFTHNLHAVLQRGDSILVEAPQGFDLDINHGLEYPYCTSRQTTSAQAIADAGLPPQHVKDVIAVIRPYPIRVGDQYENGEKVGTSGTYLDSEEISWEIVAERSGTPIEEISELTTVTQKLRRVFEPNWPRLKEMCQVNGVTQIALNFANYIDYGVKHVNRADRLTPKVWDWIRKIEAETGVQVTMVGTGACDCDIVDLRGIDRDLAQKAYSRK